MILPCSKSLALKTLIIEVCCFCRCWTGACRMQMLLLLTCAVHAVAIVYKCVCDMGEIGTRQAWAGCARTQIRVPLLADLSPVSVAAVLARCRWHGGQEGRRQAGSGHLPTTGGLT